jgi:AbrB family looped-hinge helix DNA binding protein
MKTELMIDAAGRVVLPQPVRRQFHLVRGSTVELQVGADAIVLRPHAQRPTLVEEKGLLVHEGTPMGDLLAAVEGDRDRRDREVAGRLP